MAIKKKKTVDAPVNLTPADRSAARAVFADSPYIWDLKALKRRLEKALGWSRGKANAAGLALMEEGPVVTLDNDTYYQGAAAKSCLFTYADGVLTSEDGRSIETLMGALPGDLFDGWRTVNGGVRINRLIRHTKLRWLVRFNAKVKQGYEMVAENAYDSYAFLLPLDTKPQPKPGVVYEVEITEDAATGVFYADQKAEAEDALFEDWGVYRRRCDTLPAKLVRLVAKKGDPLGELEIAKERHGIRTVFPDDVKEESAAISQKVTASQRRNRVDLRDIPFVTIDGEDARDFDDAVYCETTKEGWRLLVAIADVSYYVKPDHPLDKEAQARGTSVYFPATVVPMLPEALSNGICSLNPEVERLAMVCDALIDREGQTTAYQFYPAVIRSHARLTYTQVWAALCGKQEGFDAVGERLFEIERLYELYQTLHAARKKRCALDFETREIKAVFGAKGQIESFRPYEITDANRLIEECMLVANVAAADFVLRHKKYTLFRVHDKPEADRIADLQKVLRPNKLRLVDATAKSIAKLLEEIQASPSTAPLQIAVLRTMARAQYSPDNIGHFGLQYSQYAHFTSPIRRYPDLLLHRTIKGILSRRTYHPKLYDASGISGYHAEKLGFRPAFEKPIDEMEKKDREHEVWRRLGGLTSIAERRADDASRDVFNYLSCKWLSEQGQQKKFSARIVNVLDSGVIVRLDENGLEGYVHVSNLGDGYYDFTGGAFEDRYSKRVFRVGTQMHVRVDEIDFEKRRFSFASTSAGNRVRHSRRPWDDFDEFNYF